MEPGIFSYSRIKNVSVKDADGHTLGEVYDLLLDSQSGEIACFLLVSGGFLGIGEKYLPIPYEALLFNQEEDFFRLNIPEETLKNAPEVDIQDPTHRPDKAYLEEVYAYYGYRSVR